MKVLFLHPNFPAQFKHACNALAMIDGVDIKFICQTHYGRTIKGVDRVVAKGKGSHEYMNENFKNENEKMDYRSTVYGEIFKQLSKLDWNPDVVVSHCGWGCGIYVKEVWPNTQLISYMEWWFDPNSEFTSAIKKNKNIGMPDKATTKLWRRNIMAAMEMGTSDEIITPTKWQKKQLPTMFQRNCVVIPDNVDPILFKPDKTLRRSEPVITYGTRGMEPIRGFPEFIKMIPDVLKKYPDLTIEIAGEDEVNYGSIKPPLGSWGKWAKAYLSQIPTKKVKWMGRMPLDKYAAWLKSSWCHIYLSEPFVTSWSFLEAIRCGIPIVASKYESIMEIAPSNKNILYVDHHDRLRLVEAVCQQLRKECQEESPPEDGAKSTGSGESGIAALILQIGNRPHLIDQGSRL